MDTSRVDGVKAPPHDGTPRSRRVRFSAHCPSASANLSEKSVPGEDDSYDFGSGAGFYVDASVYPWSQYYNMYDLGVPRCCGAFTPSTRLVTIRGGRGWFIFRF